MDDSTYSEQSRKPSFIRRMAMGVPTLIVLAILCAVGAWGHRTGWKASKFSELIGGKGASAQPEDWCLAHNVPDSRCIACHPELVGESGAEWCKEHGVPESRCSICHPEILTTGVAGDWCREHGLPESGCTLCHPEIARKGELPADGSDVIVSDGSGDAAKSVSKGISAVRDPATCQTHALKVQFASVASIAKAGIRFGHVVERPMSDSVLANGEVDYDRTKFARVSSRVAGTAMRVDHQLGERVRRGDLLALVDSAEVGAAKAEFLQALTAVEVTGKTSARLQTSSAAGFRTEAERFVAEGAAKEAEIRLYNARQALVNLGLPSPPEGITQESIAGLGLPVDVAKSTPSANLFPLHAPFDGLIVSRALITGDVVDPTETLFEIADTSRMWITTDVPQSEARRVALGQEMIFRPDDAQDAAVVGAVAWMSTEVDETTRTVQIRADVSNSEGVLRANAFGRVRIVVRKSPNVIAVPNEAMQWEGCCHIVFVRLSDDIFQTRKVQIGVKDAAFTEVIGGVLPGEVVVTTGSHVLKSEILKSNLGAGCCAEE